MKTKLDIRKILAEQASEAETKRAMEMMAVYWQKRCEQLESGKTDARMLIIKMSRLLTRILSLYDIAYDDAHDAKIFVEDAQRYEMLEVKP